MTQASRSRVLEAIRKALASDVSVGPAAPHPAREFDIATARPMDLVALFSDELCALGGSVIVMPDEATCAAELAAYLSEREIFSIAMQSAPLVQAMASHLSGFELIHSAGANAAGLERAGCGLLEAEALLADTGSAVVISANYDDRLLPYLPRTCAIVSKIDRLYPSMSAEALASIDNATHDRVRGEAVIITGPSRTADIEKRLVLGAHGPANIVIFLIGRQL